MLPWLLSPPLSVSVRSVRLPLQIAAEKESALRDVRKEVALLSVSVAEKVLKKSLSEGAEQAGLVDRLVDEVASSEDLKN